MITLWPYQEAVKAAVYEHLRTRDDNPCAVVPTAGGKTPIMASICRDAVLQWNGRVLILAPSNKRPISYGRSAPKSSSASTRPASSAARRRTR